MDTTTTSIPPAIPATPAKPGMLGTSLPSSVAAIAALLLFLLPFAELRCTSTSDKNDLGGLSFNSSSGAAFTNTGLGLAIGSQWKANLGGFGPFADKNDVSNRKQDPNVFALVALILAAAAAAFTFIRQKAGIVLTLVSALGSAAALIGLFFDLRSKVLKVPSGSSGNEGGADPFNLDQYKDVGLEIAFTPWFFACVILLLATVWLSFRRNKLS
ncbi:MAG: hypothetical protein QM781_21330 [Chitinophagaceae bacterium]